MFVTVGLLHNFHIECVGLFLIHLLSTLQVPSQHGSVVIAIKPKARELFVTVVTCLLCSPQEETGPDAHTFQKSFHDFKTRDANFVPTSQVQTSNVLVLFIPENYKT
jgi:hypothetical protein